MVINAPQSNTGDLMKCIVTFFVLLLVSFTSQAQVSKCLSKVLEFNKWSKLTETQLKCMMEQPRIEVSLKVLCNEDKTDVSK